MDIKEFIKNFLPSKDNKQESDIFLSKTIEDSSGKTIPNAVKAGQIVVLDDKVDQFIEWYNENMVKGNYNGFYEYQETAKLRNFIEKMAVWYELRYPDYEINRLMPCDGEVITKINQVMFEKNPYINEVIGENTDIQSLDWAEFYNAKSFIESLPLEERFYLSKPRYPEIVNVYSEKFSPHFHLTAMGTVTGADFMKCLRCNDGEMISSWELEGKDIKQAVKIMIDKGIHIPEDSNVIQAIKNYENLRYRKEEMLNCVMYRIIERGENRIAPRRAFLFAKEFGRNIDIPMIFGIDRADPYLENFVDKYLEAGGSEELACYVGYLIRAAKYKKLNIISIKELMKK